MNDELGEKNMNGNSRGLFETLYRNFSEGTEENHENVGVRIANNSAENRIMHLSNAVCKYPLDCTASHPGR
jgi:hypothetical protein